MKRIIFAALALAGATFAVPAVAGPMSVAQPSIDQSAAASSVQDIGWRNRGWNRGHHYGWRNRGMNRGMHRGMMHRRMMHRM